MIYDSPKTKKGRIGLKNQRLIGRRFASVRPFLLVHIHIDINLKSQTLKLLMPFPKIQYFHTERCHIQEDEDDMIQRHQKKAKFQNGPVNYSKYSSVPQAISENINYPPSNPSIGPNSFPSEQSDSNDSQKNPQQQQVQNHHMHNLNNISNYPNQRFYGLHDPVPIGWSFTPQQYHYSQQGNALHMTLLRYLIPQGYMIVPVQSLQNPRAPSAQMFYPYAPKMDMNGRNASPSYYESQLGADYKDVAPNTSYVPTRQETINIREDSQDQKVNSTTVSEKSPCAHPKPKYRRKSRHPSDARRPLTAYNFFFSSDRDLILRTIAYAEKNNPTEIGTPSSTDDLSYFQNILSKTTISQDELQAHEESVHLKAQSLLDAHLESDKVKVPHRKLHGKIGFLTLGKLIAARWRELPLESKKYYFDLAEKDSTRFKNQTKILDDASRSDTKESVVTRNEAL